MIRFFKSIGVYLYKMLTDMDGDPSTKRHGFFVSVFILVGSWIANVFYHIAVDTHIIDASMALGGVTGTGIAAERFGKLLPPAVTKALGLGVPAAHTDPEPAKTVEHGLYRND